jgi:hypothetical protein
MLGCTDPVQVLLHVVCHCEDDQQSVWSSCSAVLGVSQYGHCNLLPWRHLQSSCLLAACLWYVHADNQGPWASFFVFVRVSRKASLVSFHNSDLNCLPSVSCLNDRSTGACSLIVYSSFIVHWTSMFFKAFTMKTCEVIWMFTIYLWKTASWKRAVSFFWIVCIQYHTSLPVSMPQIPLHVCICKIISANLFIGFHQCPIWIVEIAITYSGAYSNYKWYIIGHADITPQG